MDVMILVEVDELSLRRQMLNMELNNKILATNLDLINELKNKPLIQEEDKKIIATRKYNSKVVSRSFRLWDLVWRMRSKAIKNEDKYSTN